MNTLKNKKIVNKKTTDPIDRLVFEEGLRINDVYINKDLDLIIVLLNNKKIIQRPLSDFVTLYKASLKQLKIFECDGIGIHWPTLDEDLSLRGFLKYEISRINRPLVE